MKHLSAQKKQSHSSASHTACWPQHEGLVTALHRVCFSQRSSASRRRKSAGDWLGPNWTWFTDYALGGVCMLPAHCGPVYEWPKKHWAQYAWAHTAGEESGKKRMSVHEREECWRERACGGLPSHLTRLDKLRGNITNIDLLLKSCSVDLPLHWNECSHSASRTLLQ